ncbi:MAG: hypothetical protein MR016_07380 [Agathobacter sp.]|nr:hypothetical protein [Agathobacter sp.]
MILKYEWKKIVCNRINQIAMLIGYIIMAVTVIVPIRSEYVNEYQKGITYQGIEAVKYEQQFSKDQTDYLTEEYLTGQLQKLQQMNLDLESDDGFDLPVQLFANEIPYSMTMGQLMLLQLLASFAMIILTVGLILAISALTRSSMATSVSMFVLLVGPAFLKFTDNRIYNHILALTTVRLVDLKQCLCQFMDYRIGNHVVGLIPVSIAVHFIVGIILLLMCRILWVRKTIR